MKRFWLFAVALGAVDAFALKKNFCELRFTSSVEHVVHHLDFTHLQNRRAFSTGTGELSELVRLNGLSVLINDKEQALGLIFDIRPGRDDTGYWVRGKLRGDTLVVHHIRSGANETEYFRRIAALRGIGPAIVPVGRSIMNCSQLRIEGWAQVKLAMKHRLSIPEVAELVSRPSATIRLDPPPRTLNKKRARGAPPPRPRKPHYLIEEIDQRGNPFFAVIEEDGCPHGLITAFDNISLP